MYLGLDQASNQDFAKGGEGALNSKLKSFCFKNVSLK